MENSSKSESEKHNHAVVVNYLFSKKSDLDKIKLIRENVEKIKDKTSKELDFCRLKKMFLSEPPLLESTKREEWIEVLSKEDFDELKKLLEEAKKKDSVKKNQDPLSKWEKKDSKHIRRWPIWGRYDNDNRRIILYVNNILDYFTDKDGKTTDDVKFDKCKRITEIHEKFHAYFHFVTEQSIHRDKKYNYIFEIEEAMAEFCSLIFLSELSDVFKGVFDIAKEMVEDKQNEVGDLAAYGFGAYLYDNLNEDERFELINNYIKKLGNINEEDDKVKEYKREVRLSKWGDQQKCLKLLQEILKP